MSLNKLFDFKGKDLGFKIFAEEIKCDELLVGGEVVNHNTSNASRRFDITDPPFDVEITSPSPIASLVSRKANRGFISSPDRYASYDVAPDATGLTILKTGVYTIHGMVEYSTNVPAVLIEVTFNIDGGNPSVLTRGGNNDVSTKGIVTAYGTITVTDVPANIVMGIGSNVVSTLSIKRWDLSSTFLSSLLA